MLLCIEAAVCLSQWWQWWRGAGCVPWHEVNRCSVTARMVPVPASRSWQGELCPACNTGSGAAPSLCRLQQWHLSLAHGGWIPFAAFLPRVSFALKTCLPDGLRWDTMPSVFLPEHHVPVGQACRFVLDQEPQLQLI